MKLKNLFWIGPAIQEENSGTVVFYRGVALCTKTRELRTIFQPGDIVTVFSDDDEPHVAEIVSLFAHSGKSDMFMRARWLYRQRDTEKEKLDKLIEKEGVAPNELFFSEHEDTNSLLTVKGHCCVGFAGVDDSLRNTTGLDYWCGHQYDPARRTFKRYFRSMQRSSSHRVAKEKASRKNVNLLEGIEDEISLQSDVQSSSGSDLFSISSPRASMALAAMMLENGISQSAVDIKHEADNDSQASSSNHHKVPTLKARHRGRTSSDCLSEVSEEIAHKTTIPPQVEKTPEKEASQKDAAGAKHTPEGCSTARLAMDPPSSGMTPLGWLDFSLSDEELAFQWFCLDSSQSIVAMGGSFENINEELLDAWEGLPERERNGWIGKIKPLRALLERPKLPSLSLLKARREQIQKPSTVDSTAAKGEEGRKRALEVPSAAASPKMAKLTSSSLHDIDEASPPIRTEYTLSQQGSAGDARSVCSGSSGGELVLKLQSEVSARLVDLTQADQKPRKKARLSDAFTAEQEQERGGSLPSPLDTNRGTASAHLSLSEPKTTTSASTELPPPSTALIINTSPAAIAAEAVAVDLTIDIADEGDMEVDARNGPLSTASSMLTLDICLTDDFVPRLPMSQAKRSGKYKATSPAPVDVSNASEASSEMSQPQIDVKSSVPTHNLEAMQRAEAAAAAASRSSASAAKGVDLQSSTMLLGGSGAVMMDNGRGIVHVLKPAAAPAAVTSPTATTTKGQGKTMPFSPAAKPSPLRTIREIGAEIYQGRFSEDDAIVAVHTTMNDGMWDVTTEILNACKRGAGSDRPRWTPEQVRDRFRVLESAGLVEQAILKGRIKPVMDLIRVEYGRVLAATKSPLMKKGKSAPTSATLSTPTLPGPPLVSAQASPAAAGSSPKKNRATSTSSSDPDVTDLTTASQDAVHIVPSSNSSAPPKQLAVAPPAAGNKLSAAFVPSVSGATSTGAGRGRSNSSQFTSIGPMLSCPPPVPLPLNPTEPLFRQHGGTYISDFLAKSRQLSEVIPAATRPPMPVPVPVPDAVLTEQQPVAPVASSSKHPPAAATAGGGVVSELLASHYDLTGLKFKQPIKFFDQMGRIGKNFQAELPALRGREELRIEEMPFSPKIWTTTFESKEVDHFLRLASDQVKKLRMNWLMQHKSAINVATTCDGLVVDGGLVVVNGDLQQILLNIYARGQANIAKALSAIPGEIQKWFAHWSHKEQLAFKDVFMEKGFDLKEFQNALPGKSQLTLSEYYYRFVYAGAQLQHYMKPGKGVVGALLTRKCGSSDTTSETGSIASDSPYAKALAFLKTARATLEDVIFHELLNSILEHHRGVITEGEMLTRIRNSIHRATFNSKNLRAGASSSSGGESSSSSQALIAAAKTEFMKEFTSFIPAFTFTEVPAEP